MNIIKLQVKNFEIIPLEKQYVVENQVNEFAIEFEFDDSWNYETKYVIFDNEETTYKRPIINNQVIIPSELLNGRTTIQVYGQNVENGEIVKRKPSYKYSFSILNSLSTEGQEESDLPKPTQWEIYIFQIETMLDEFTTDYNEFKDDITEQFNDLKEECESKCDDVIERLAQDEQDIQTNTDNIRANAEAIDALNTSLLDYSLITETGNKISMSINPQTYVITLSLKDKNDNILSTQSVDLPLETMIVSASYSNGVLTFTLKNGQTLQVPISDLISGLVSTDTFNQAVQGLSNRITTIENDYLKSTDKTELQNQITANADDIDNIQEEQLTQNADIEYLQQENERLQRIVSGLPTKNASGTNFVLNDMVNCEIKEISLKGDTLQDGTPTPDTPVEIQTVTGNQEINVFGKNLFDINDFPFADGRSYGNNGELTYWSGYKAILNYFPVKENTTYNFSNNLNKGIYYGLVFYDENKEKIGYITSTTFTFTTPSRCKYIRFAIQSETIPSWVQIEFGDTPTSYEKYKTPQTKTISLGNIELCKIGTYQDKIYKSNDKWYLEKNVGKYTAIESTGYWYLSGNNHCFKSLLENTPLNNIAPYNFDNSLNIGAFNRLLKQALPNDLYLGNEVNAFGISNTQSVGIYFRIYGIDTREDFINWLNTNQPVIYYAYATPVITEITDDNLINQLEDVYNIILNENNTIIINGNLPSDTLVIGYADIAKLIASLSSQDNRNVVEENTRKIEEPIEEPIETKEEER